MLQKTNPRAVLQNSLVGQQVWNQSILMGKYSSDDIKRSPHEYFRSVLRTLSPFPDQRLNNGLKEKLYDLFPLSPFNWSLATVSKSNRRVIRRVVLQLCPQRTPSQGPGILLNSNNDGRGKSEFGDRICHLKLLYNCFLLCYHLTMLESSRK